MLLFGIVACGYRPARFADRPPVESLADDRPIALPRVTPFIEPVYLSDIYLRRPLVDALDAERFPHAGDVNAFDEVVRSSFWQPVPLETAAFDRAYALDGPPQPPLVTGSANRVRDRRGLSYLLHDEPGAALVASRLVRAVGYPTPEVWLTASGNGALRGPLGIELGPTDPSGVRRDDPNDRIAHRDRRTLRALGVLAAWLDLGDLGPDHVVDVYVGAPGRGHVRHFLIGLESALGMPSRSRRVSGGEETAAGVVRGSFLDNLLTLGLARPKPSSPASAHALSPELGPEYRLRHPWEPSERLTAPDGYWIAKRIASIPSQLIEHSVATAKLPPDASARLLHALEARRHSLVARWLLEVTPLELWALKHGTLVLSDQAIRLGYTTDSATGYRALFLDDDGNSIAQPRDMRLHAGIVELPLPPSVLARDYFVVLIFATRGGTLLPRPFEAHVSTRGGPHVVGIRH